LAKVLRFEGLEIRVEERTVAVAGEAAALGARAFDLLLALAERCERVVSKAELLDLAWPGLVVEENNLTVQISTLRRLLGPAAIATVTGRGYRLTLSPLAAPSPAPAGPDARGAEAAPAPMGRLERRMAAVVQAEVVGWARLVNRDAMSATLAWKRVRVELIEKIAPQYGGRLIELTPERVLLEFRSAVEALSWSLDMQGELAERRQVAEPGESDSVHMRIGISVDDLIVDDGKLVGDGVNLAADLQRSAGHDEVLLTHKVHDLAWHKLDAQFEDLGERLMQAVGRSVRVFRARTAPRVCKTPATVAALRSAAVRVASLAVLPLESGSGPENQYFGDGITEEIISRLSLNREIFVVAHNSTLRFRSAAADLPSVASQLGVRYLVVGRVQRSGQQVRISVSLIFGPDARVLWQQNFDGNTEDLFAFQSEIATNVSAAIAPQVQEEEVAQVRGQPTGSFDAYECVLRGLSGILKLGTPEFESAGAQLKRAVELDPNYAQAHAHLGWWYSLRDGELRGNTGPDEGKLALEHAMTAVRLDPRDASALSIAGYLLTLQQRKYEQSLEMYEQALTINPSSAAAWARSAATLCYLGRSEEAIERIKRAVRLSPFDQHMFWHLTMYGSACFVAKRYDEAIGWLGKALRLNPRFNGARRLQIAALALTAQLDEARELAAELLAESPGYSVSAVGRWSPMLEPQLSALLEGLRLAGLPD
jgi:adenylate cyclase